MKVFQITLFLFLFAFVNIQAQDKEALMDEIASKACECAKDLDIANMSESEIQTKLGVCMMQNMMSMDQSKLKELNIDMTDQQSMTEFGQKIGFKMAAKCPEVMMVMAKTQMDNSGSSTPSTPSIPGKNASNSYSQVSGTVKGLVGKDVTFVQLEDASGAISAFMWLEAFEGDQSFKSNPNGLVGKKVRITYDKIDVYSANSKTYSSRKVIKGITIE